VATVYRWRNADPAEPAAPTEAAVCRVPRPRRAPTTVSVRRVASLADSWAERAAGGLTAEQARTLLDELRALASLSDSTLKPTEESA
jgi:hypothetical protein